jgi:hypothetical protein
VGIFYFTHSNRPGQRIWNNAAILEKTPNAVLGPLYSPHWWGEPLFGFYIDSDPFVLREHAVMLGDAGINTIILDNTYGVTFFRVDQKLFKTWLHMKALGNTVPDFVCFAGRGAVRSAGHFIFHGGNGAWTADYQNIYKTGLAKKLWFYWDGKPLMLIYGNIHKLPAAIRHLFTLRYCWEHTGGKNRWSWNNTPRKAATAHKFNWLFGWHINPHTPEEMPVAAAGWATGSTGRSSSNGIEPTPSRQHPGRGICFAEQWQHALRVDPAFIFITGWNEWTCGCRRASSKNYFAGRWVSKGQPVFVDEYSPEFSRDIEPMKEDKGGLYGGFGDNYYYQMVANIRRYKGVHRLPCVHPAVIHIRGPFSQWNRIGPLFINNVGLAVHRNSPGWGNAHYINNTGRNDIVASKFT